MAICLKICSPAKASLNKPGNLFEHTFSSTGYPMNKPGNLFKNTFSSTRYPEQTDNLFENTFSSTVYPEQTWQFV